MNLLIDTQSFLWLVWLDAKLSAKEWCRQRTFDPN